MSGTISRFARLICRLVADALGQPAERCLGLIGLSDGSAGARLPLRDFDPTRLEREVGWRPLESSRRLRRRRLSATLCPGGRTPDSGARWPAGRVAFRTILRRLEALQRPPTHLPLQPGRIDRVAEVVPRPIRSIADQPETALGGLTERVGTSRAESGGATSRLCQLIAGPDQIRIRPGLPQRTTWSTRPHDRPRITSPHVPTRPVHRHRTGRDGTIGLRRD